MRDVSGWQMEMQLQSQMERSLGSLEIEATYALVAKVQGGVSTSAFGPAVGQVFAPARDIFIPQSPPGVDIDSNIMRARASVSVSWFIDQVKPGGDMDYKIKGQKLQYEDFGNFNYGAIATAFGFSEQAALRAAGLVQVYVNAKNKIENKRYADGLLYGAQHALEFLGSPPYGDEEKDQKMIKLGIRYYHEVFMRKYSKSEIQNWQDALFDTMRSEERKLVYDAMVKGYGVTRDVVKNILKSLD